MNGSVRLFHVVACVVGVAACGYPSLPELGDDRDGDGVPDTIDNCPNDKNPDQVNEDGDRFGDICDPCPQISDNIGTDSDGDHIGDACDPNPGVHDTVWMYEGFHSGLPTWSQSPNWTAVDDKIRTIAAGNTTNDGEYMFTPFTTLASPNNFSAAMTVLVEQMIGLTGDHSVGLQVKDTNANKAVNCGLDQNPAGSNSILFLTDSFNTLNKTVSFAWTTNTEYRITVTRHGSIYTCSVVGPAGMQTASGTSAVVPQDGNSVDIWAYGAIAQYGSVQIIGTP